MISGFTFVHNALRVGIPIIEAIRAVQPYVDETLVIDAESDDGTRQAIEKLPGVRVIDSQWGNQAGATLERLHSLHTECKNDIILHFEADEVYSNKLLKHIVRFKNQGIKNMAICRIQVEQNFQRIRWYTEPVHRVFMKGSVKKVGHTTDKHNDALLLTPEKGFLWDCTNNFRDNFLARIDQQANLWGQHNYKVVPSHFTHPYELSREEIASDLLKQMHWYYKKSPFNIPRIIRPLVGKLKYHDG